MDYLSCKRVAVKGLLGLALVAAAAGCGDITRTGSGTGGGGAGAAENSSQVNAPIGGDVGTNATGTPNAAGASSTETGPSKPVKDGSATEK